MKIINKGWFKKGENIGDKNNKWKGDNVGYGGIHQWLIKNYDKLNKCENKDCKCKNPKRFEWALIKNKKYERKRENFIILCSSCHRKYDMTTERCKNISKRMLNNTFKRLPIIQYTKTNKIIKKWESITKASNELGILLGSIGNCLRETTKSSGGFIWKYVKNN